MIDPKIYKKVLILYFCYVLKWYYFKVIISIKRSKFLPPLLPPKKHEIVTNLCASVRREFLCESLCRKLWRNTDIFALCNNPIC